jgi:hypothetical protein
MHEQASRRASVGPTQANVKWRREIAHGVAARVVSWLMGSNFGAE